MSIAAGLQQHQHYRVNIRSTVSAVAAEVLQQCQQYKSDEDLQQWVNNRSALHSSTRSANAAEVCNEAPALQDQQLSAAQYQQQQRAS